MADRQSWSFEQNLAPDLRSARALEYIAHYLDRIDQNLERLGQAVDGDNGLLLKQLNGMNGFLEQIARAQNQRGR